LNNNEARKKKQFTREIILKQIGREDLINDNKTPLSINDILPFFQKNKINFVALDTLDKIIARYQVPEKERNGSVHLICGNAHCELVNQDVISLGRIMHGSVVKEAEEEQLSNNYYVKKEGEEEPEKYFVMLENKKDIIKLIVDNHKEEKIFNCVIKDDNLEKIYSFGPQMHPTSSATHPQKPLKSAKNRHRRPPGAPPSKPYPTPTTTLRHPKAAYSSLLASGEYI